MTTQIPLDKIIPNPDQPRTVFDQAELEALAGTIRGHGVILPISVEQSGDYYILIEDEKETVRARLRAEIAVETDDVSRWCLEHSLALLDDPDWIGNA